MQNRSSFLFSAGWLLLFILLPITSLPLLSSLLGSSMVAAPSAVILLFLVIFWMLPAIWKREGIPPQSKPLAAFVTVALISSLLSLFLFIPAYKQVNNLVNILEGVITLGAGVCFYLATSMWFKDEKQLRNALRWINWGGVFIIVWSLVQAVFAYNATAYPDWMYGIQRALSSSGRLYLMRVTGTAFEPSWLAHQLSMLYLPFWLAATVKNVSAHSWRIWKIKFENILLLGGLAVLWLSSSRVGLLSFLVSVAYLFYLLNVWVVNWITHRVQAKRTTSRLKSRLIAGTVVVFLLSAYAGIFLGTSYALSQSDPRMKRLFDFSTISQDGFFAYANQLIFAERVAFWDVGWKVFNDHPIIGVGLGNAGYFFPEKISAFGWGLVEIHDVVLRSSTIPNTKALWSRLPAETGLIGVAAFATWLLILFQSNKMTIKYAPRFLQTVGLASQLTLVALLVEGFSLDTFALPYFWISFGLGTAAWRTFRNNYLPEPKDAIESEKKLELPVSSEEKC